MNKFILFPWLVSVGLFLCCNCADSRGDGSYPIRATIYFINDTSIPIISEGGCQRDVLPNETIAVQVEEILGVKPNADSFPVSIFYCSMKYNDGNVIKCENGIENIDNYENRKEVSPLNFEFTFRFTDERFQAADECK